jgi:hypothetical protein
MTEEQNQQIALYQGVNVEKAAYMAAFSQAGGLQSIIDQITQQAHEQAKGLDASTAANRKKLASIAYSVAQAKTGIDGEGKDLVSEAKAKIKVVDDNRKAVRDKLDTLRDTIRQPVTDYEQAEQERLAAIQAVLDQLDTLASANDSDGQRLSAEQLHMRKHQAADLAKNDYGDMAADVAAKAESTLKYLDTAIAAAEEYEQQQAEIERMRTEQAAREQADYEAKIAAEAAEKARAEAEAKAKAEREASERARIEAQLKAEQAERDKQAAIDRAEAEKQAAVQAERLRIEAEAAQAEKAEAERAANVENQRKVNRTVMAVMLECGIEEEAAKAFLIKVIQGKVPHLKITY